MKVFEIFPQQESFMDSSPDRCRTCAVVGNSVNLLGSHYGPLIDLHDVIMRTYRRMKSTVKANQGLVKVLHPGFIQYVHENWLGKEGRYPSTGFMGVVLAMHICDEVSVFGFGADKDGNWRHYWEELQNKHYGTGPHGGGQEYKRILELAEKQKLNFYKGF
ncbi:unnamed protein product [Arctogadus glacialis]